MASERPCFLDATVLSNFASTSAIGWLVGLLERPPVVPAVRNVLEAGRGFGHEFLEEALEAIATDIELVEVTGDADLETLRERLDPGESESVRVAIESGGALATDDSAARAVARDRGVDVTGSVGLLVLGIEREMLDVETADRWLETWRWERSYYSPVERISEALEE